MSTMTSWHKIGQTVAMKDDQAWNVIEGAKCGDEPAYGTVYSIGEVCCVRDQVYFRLREVRAVSLFDARSFVPVYPTIIDQLRNLEALRPEHERASEDA